jgi:hypothetical protein
MEHRTALLRNKTIVKNKRFKTLIGQITKHRKHKYDQNSNEGDRKVYDLFFIKSILIDLEQTFHFEAR